MKTTVKGKPLSKREKEVVEELMRDGAGNKDIARRLFVCEKTIKFHFTTIFKKTGVKNRLALIHKINQVSQHGFRKTYW